ncbi:sugar phosphate isomerase/epimerase family protein [Cohnella hashimotonis]|uniref:Sugar phosphate isomerase/epimerase family protein n=1 Tax=Cohnella hashimotonis TaxID=2826895 RepID=A0ABT6TTE7_9BACL|nr:sugar phosphate isomerase/epimerase family protein [Cohnella hashimotonis]
MKERVLAVAPSNVLYKFHSLGSFLAEAVRCGCETIELWGGAPHLDIEAATPADLKKLRRRLAELELRVCCLTPETGLYPVNIASNDPVLRQRSEIYAMKSLEAAAELQVPIMQVTSGTGYYDRPAEEAWRRSADFLSRLSRRAAALGIRLALEALPVHESNLVRDAASLRRMLDEVGQPALGALLDTSTAAALGESPADYIRLLGADRIAHIQLVDGPGGHLAWGDGTLSLAEYLASIRAAGYAGSLGLELFDHKYYVDPAPVLRRAAGALREALQPA